MAVRNTHHRFDPRFPRTGGGEDIDFCLRACGGGGGGMLAVPEVGGGRSERACVRERVCVSECGSLRVHLPVGCGTT